MKGIRVKLTFTEGILGTSPNDEEIYRRFIVDKGRNNGAEIPEAVEVAELEALPVDEQIEKGMTVFPRTEDGRPFLWDYQIKGFFKDTCAMLKKVPGTRSSKVKAYKKEIDGLIFPVERQIVFENAEMEVRFALEDDAFQPMGTEDHEKPDAGELVYVSGHTVKTRRWTWRQSEDGKITEETRNILYPLDGFTDINLPKVMQAQQELQKRLEALFRCKTYSGFIDKDHLSFSW